MSLCNFLEQKPQYAGTISNFGNFPKSCPILAVSECNPTLICIPDRYVSYENINLKYKGFNLYSVATNTGLFASTCHPSVLTRSMGYSYKSLIARLEGQRLESQRTDEIEILY
jgi:hypothetical protein